MSVNLKYISGAPVIVTLNVPTSTTIVKDQVMALDVSNDGVIPGTSTSTVLTIIAVSQEAVTTTSSTDRIRSILIEPAQIWQITCNANTAANQECNHHKLTDGLIVDNTGTDDATTTGLALMLRRVGVASDKKAEFQLISLPQVTA